MPGDFARFGVLTVLVIGLIGGFAYRNWPTWAILPEGLFLRAPERYVVQIGGPLAKLRDSAARVIGSNPLTKKSL